MYTRGQHHTRVLELYRDIGRMKSSHPGRVHVRSALDALTLQRNDTSYHCLVPMWDSFTDLLYRNPARRFSEDLLKAALQQVLQGLDFLHTECNLIHTRLSSDLS